MEKLYFYAPNKNTHSFFEQKSLDWAEIVKARKFNSGNFTSWIVSTYLQVNSVGFACEVVDYIPKQGIVIADRDTLGNKYPYLGQVMLICAKGDREFHPSAHLHIIHNPSELLNQKNTVWNPYYIPHWPQPSLIPRSFERGTEVKNVAFMGTRSNLTQELSSDKWIYALEKLGCKWNLVLNPNKWNDYSDIDIVVAVRSFNRLTYNNKPASKLINCWRAGVPAIVTPESAFLAVKKSELDFLTVDSLEKTIQAVERLKTEPEFYLSMVNNGNQRAQEFSEETITQLWINFFNQYVFPQYQQWQKSSELNRRTLFLKRYTRLKLDRVTQKLQL